MSKSDRIIIWTSFPIFNRPILTVRFYKIMNIVHWIIWYTEIFIILKGSLQRDTIVWFAPHHIDVCCIYTWVYATLRWSVLWWQGRIENTGHLRLSRFSWGGIKVGMLFKVTILLSSTVSYYQIKITRLSFPTRARLLRWPVSAGNSPNGLHIKCAPDYNEELHCLHELS